MDVNIPEIVEEVTAAFMSYEKAITENDVKMINHQKWYVNLHLKHNITRF